jgi:hypothetical protein
MKKVISIFVFVLIILTSTLSFADCEVVEFDTTAFDDLVETISITFPFSVIYFAIDMLDDISQISSQSPSGIEIPLAFMTIKPLSFLDDIPVFANTIMPIIRYFMLGSLLLAMALFLIEKVL